MPDELSAAQARRLAVAAQGLSGTRLGEAAKRVDRRHFRRVLDQLGCVQLDSVNVVTRAHEVAFFARLGPYDRAALARWLHDSGEVFEYWGHAASFLPVDLHPALRFKMDAARDGAAYGGLVQLMRERPDYLEDVRAAVRDRGPLVAADLHDGEAPRRTESWWGWDPPKRALEALFWCGELSARRGARFERYYDLPERILPPAIVEAPTPPLDEQRRILVRRAARALGVGTVRDLADYFRQKIPQTRPVIEAMAADGELLPVRVEGWKEPAYLDPAAKVPRRVTARRVVAPFDSLVWERARALRVFGFDYRIEIYVPEPKRRYGYYVFPFLLDDQLVARVDLKADRPGRRLLVQSSWLEAGHDAERVAAALIGELRLMAGWLDLDDVTVVPRGDLAATLAAVSSG